MQRNQVKKAKKKGKKKNGQPRNRARRGGNMIGGNAMNDFATHVQLGKPTNDYARMQADPVDGPLVGATDYPACLSGKYRPFARGSFTLPATGVGFLVADPDWGALGGVNAVYFVDPAYVGTTINTAAGSAIGAGTNAPYAAGQFGPAETQAFWRSNAAMLRLRYSGTEYYKGGSIVATVDPKHRSLYGNDFAACDQYDDAVRFTGKQMGDWMNLPYRQLDDTDTKFKQTLPTYTPTDQDPSFYMGFMIQMPAATPATFDWEFHVCAEYIGTFVQNKTHTVYDPVGWGAIHTASVQSKKLRRAHQMTGEQAQAEATRAVASAASQSTHVTHLNRKGDAAAAGAGSTAALVGAAVGAAILGFLF